MENNNLSKNQYLVNINLVNITDLINNMINILRDNSCDADLSFYDVNIQNLNI